MTNIRGYWPPCYKARRRQGRARAVDPRPRRRRPRPDAKAGVPFKSLFLPRGGLAGLPALASFSGVALSRSAKAPSSSSQPICASPT